MSEKIFGQDNQYPSRVLNQAPPRYKLEHYCLMQLACWRFTLKQSLKKQDVWVWTGRRNQWTVHENIGLNPVGIM